MVKAKLYILDLGDLECDKAWIVALPNPGLVDNKNPPAIWMKAPSIAVYLDHPEAKILFDTGCSPRWRETWPELVQRAFPWTREVPLEEALKKVGVKPDDLDYVVISHLHMDHAGGLYLFANKKAKIVVQREEAREAFTSVFCYPELALAYVRSDFAIDGLNWMLLDGDYELVTDVTLLSLPGHSPGCMGMMVTLDKAGTMIFSSDSCYTAENYGPPVKMPGIVVDTVSYAKSVERIRSLARKYNAQVIFGHDPEQWKTLKMAPEYYE